MLKIKILLLKFYYVCQESAINIDYNWIDSVTG